jgi:hypothetical protein
MQTFLPEANDIRSGFDILDYRRLGKQRVETWQILNVLRGVDNEGNPKDHKGWVNHPATKMWRGHPGGLAMYGLLNCNEWTRRGYKDTMTPRFQAVLDTLDVTFPEWFTDDARIKEVARTHQSNLIRKDEGHYKPLWPNVPDNLEYDWPVS